MRRLAFGNRLLITTTGAFVSFTILRIGVTGWLTAFILTYWLRN